MRDTPHMTPAEFRAACAMLWGDGLSWGVQGAAQFLGVSERNVRRFGDGSKLVGPGLAGVLLEEVRRRIFDEADHTPSLVVVRRAMARATALAD